MSARELRFPPDGATRLVMRHRRRERETATVPPAISTLGDAGVLTRGVWLLPHRVGGKTPVVAVDGRGEKLLELLAHENDRIVDVIRAVEQLLDLLDEPADRSDEWPF